MADSKQNVIENLDKLRDQIFLAQKELNQLTIVLGDVFMLAVDLQDESVQKLNSMSSKINYFQEKIYSFNNVTDGISYILSNNPQSETGNLQKKLDGLTGVADSASSDILSASLKMQLLLNALKFIKKADTALEVCKKGFIAHSYQKKDIVELASKVAKDLKYSARLQEDENPYLYTFIEDSIKFVQSVSSTLQNYDDMMRARIFITFMKKEEGLIKPIQAKIGDPIECDDFSEECDLNSSPLTLKTGFLLLGEVVSIMCPLIE